MTKLAYRSLNDLKNSSQAKETYYTIKDLEKLSGIKAHTIRIWEKRYTIINPLRTETNIRYYNSHDLKKIMMISILNNNGSKISKIASLTLRELTEKVDKLTSDKSGMEIFIDQLVITMIDLDEVSFDHHIKNFIKWHGFKKTITDIIFPFCEKIGILWLIDKIHPAHEHFISNMIRLKLFSEIDKIGVIENETEKVVLFLREGEMHELGLLFYNYLLRESGYQTIYLGQNVPMDDLLKVIDYYDPKYIVSAVVMGNDDEEIRRWVKDISGKFPDRKIVLSGQFLNDIAIQYPSNVSHARHASALLDKF